MVDDDQVGPCLDGAQHQWGPGGGGYSCATCGAIYTGPESRVLPSPCTRTSHVCNVCGLEVDPAIEDGWYGHPSVIIELGPPSSGPFRTFSSSYSSCPHAGEVIGSDQVRQRVDVIPVM